MPKHLRMPAVRDLVAAYKDGRTTVEDLCRYHRVSRQTLYHHLDRSGVPRRRPQAPRLPVGEVVDLELHVLPVFPVRLVPRPGCRLGETVVPAGRLRRLGETLAQPGEEG